MIIFALGAIGYAGFEILFRGYTHWTMMLTGGACVLTMYYFFMEFRHASFLSKGLGGAVIITTYEFFVGLIVNVWFGWHVWDYSQVPGNVLGIICPQFSFIWFILSLALAAIIDKLPFMKKIEHTG